MNQGMMLQTINNAKLHSFKCKFKTIFGSSEISITPFIYKAYEENTLDISSKVETEENANTEIKDENSTADENGSEK